MRKGAPDFAEQAVHHSRQYPFRLVLQVIPRE